MQRFFTYGRKRRKVQDVSDVRLPGAARQMDAKRQRKTVIAILIAIKTMPALLLCRHYFFRYIVSVKDRNVSYFLWHEL